MPHRHVYNKAKRKDEEESSDNEEKDSPGNRATRDVKVNCRSGKIVLKTIFKACLPEDISRASIPEK
jgi:hypothetical protein